MNNHLVEILLVEDNPHDAELTIRTLRKANLANHLLHVRDGEAALDFIFTKGVYAARDFFVQPKLILLDINMPKVNGLEVLRQIKAHDATKMIPVVIMTASKAEQDRLAGYTTGANSYVVKPVDFIAFAAAVSSLGLYWLLTNQRPV